MTAGAAFWLADNVIVQVPFEGEGKGEPFLVIGDSNPEPIQVEALKSLVGVLNYLEEEKQEVENDQDFIGFEVEYVEEEDDE